MACDRGRSGVGVLLSDDDLHRTSRWKGMEPASATPVERPVDGRRLPTWPFGVVGQIVPIEAGMAIVLYIGLVITAQAFDATAPMLRLSPWADAGWRAAYPH